MKVNWLLVIILPGLITLYCKEAVAQQQSLTLPQLLQIAQKNYPLLKSKMLNVQAAQKAVEVSKNTKIPSLDAAYQMNYATYNNITGMAYPQFVIPISGPPSTTNNFNGVFGSAASLLFNWQPITFGQREAQIAYSQAGVKYASADAANEILQHKIKVANAYLDALTYGELDKLYQENITRAATNLSTVKTLVVNGIKPGVDSALFSAELSKAKIDRLGIQKNEEQAIIALTQLLAIEENISIADSSFFTELPVSIITNDTIANPLLSLYNTSIELDKAKRKSIAKTTAPTLGFWATTYAKGSGIAYNGDVKTLDGLGLQRYNYGVGVQLSVPLLQSLKIKPELQQQDLQINADQEKLNEITLQLNKQLQTAKTTMDYTLKTIKEMPVLLQSSNFAYSTIVSRYNAGLANYADVVQAQYNLLKAQTDYKTSYMAAWKTLLYKAAIKGDINLFLNQVN
jgi:outer membrane protein